MILIPLRRPVSEIEPTRTVQRQLKFPVDTALLERGRLQHMKEALHRRDEPNRFVQWLLSVRNRYLALH